MKTHFPVRILAIIGLTLILGFRTTQAQVVNANVLTRTFPIKHRTQSGTAFTVEVDKRQYLVTAKHVVSDIKAGDKIEFFWNNEWKPIPVTPIACANTNVDITVLIPPTLLTPSLPIDPDSDGLIIGQDMYFLGYPYGLHSVVNGASGTPIAFVKQGICSALDLATTDCQIIYLDGHNNPGFSGGPVVFQDQATKKLKIAGVVSGFRFENTSVNNRDLDTGLTIKANTGIVVVYDIKSAVEAIKKNPTGPMVK